MNVKCSTVVGGPEHRDGATIVELRCILDLLAQYRQSVIARGAKTGRNSRHSVNSTFVPDFLVCCRASASSYLA